MITVYTLQETQLIPLLVHSDICRLSQETEHDVVAEIIAHLLRVQPPATEKVPLTGDRFAGLVWQTDLGSHQHVGVLGERLEGGSRIGGRSLAVERCLDGADGVLIDRPASGMRPVSQAFRGAIDRFHMPDRISAAGISDRNGSFERYPVAFHCPVLLEGVSTNAAGHTPFHRTDKQRDNRSCCWPIVASRA